MSPHDATDGPHEDPQTHLDTDPVNRPDSGEDDDGADGADGEETA